MKKLIDFLLKYIGSTLFFVILACLLIAGMVTGTLITKINIFQLIWFKAALILLLISLIVCSARRVRWRFNFFGPLMMHISFALILIGAMISGIWGQKGSMQIFEGMGADYFYVSRFDNPITSVVKDMQILDFEVYLQEFNIEYYYDKGSQSEAISNYQSHIVIYENEKIFAEAVIEVNKPFKYKGYSFYQQSYGDHHSLEYTVLGVSKDPGMPIIYIGMAGLCAGFIFQFHLKKFILNKGEKK